jgi:glycosyltransferase involved in cell wall biosynthesis
VGPKVSVVIPAYNAEKYIAETLQSVFDQTYGNYEVVVVDDGSQDGTLELLQSYAPKIRVFSKPNGGPASARNVAIQNSDGELIAFLDSDDIWFKDKLEVQVQFLCENPAVGLTYSEALMVGQDAGESAEHKIGFTESPTFCKLLYGDFIPNSTVMIRRPCVEKVGLLDESKELIAAEDYEYWLRIAKLFPIAGISCPLAYYRVRDNGLMGDGKDIDKGLALALTVLRTVEKQYPGMWVECGVDRNKLLARLYVRAGFAWKTRGDLGRCLLKFFGALRHSFTPRVFRWIVAAVVLKRWS